jgi:hypothetical protein
LTEEFAHREWCGILFSIYLSEYCFEREFARRSPDSILDSSRSWYEQCAASPRLHTRWALTSAEAEHSVLPAGYSCHRFKDLALTAYNRPEYPANGLTILICSGAATSLSAASFFEKAWKYSVFPCAAKAALSLYLLITTD